MSEWWMFIITIIVGFIMGTMVKTTQGEIGEELQGLKQSLKRQLPHKVGAVSTPTQSEILKRQNPQLQEEEEEMRQVFAVGGENGQQPTSPR